MNRKEEYLKLGYFMGPEIIEHVILVDKSEKLNYSVRSYKACSLPAIWLFSLSVSQYLAKGGNQEKYGDQETRIDRCNFKTD